MNVWTIGASAKGGVSRDDLIAAYRALGWTVDESAIEAVDEENGVWNAPLPGPIARRLRRVGYIEYEATVEGVPVTITAEMP